MANLRNILHSSHFRSLTLMGIRGFVLVSKFLLTLFIAKFLGLEVLGLYGLILAGTHVVPSLTGLGIMYAKSRDAVTQSTQEIARTLHYYMRYILSIYSVLIFVSFCYGWFSDQLLLAVLITCILLLEHISGDFYSLLLNLSKSYIANIAHFIRSAFWIIIYIVIAYTYPEYRNIESLLIFWLIGACISLLALSYVYKDRQWRLDAPLDSLFAWMKSESKRGQMLYYRCVVTTISMYTDRGVISFFLGLEATGIYVFYWSIVGAINGLVQTGVLQIFRPKFVKFFKEKKDNIFNLFNDCIKQTLFVSTSLSIVTAGAIYYLLPYINKSDMMEWYPIFIILLFGFLFRISSSAQDLVYYGRKEDKLAFQMDVVIYLISIIITVLSIFMLGLWGAAVSYVITGMLRYIVRRKQVKCFLIAEAIAQDQKKYND